MKKNKKLITLASLFLATFTLCSLANKEVLETHAEGTWTTNNTSGIARDSTFYRDKTDAWLFIKLSNSDYSSASGPTAVTSCANFNIADYNYPSYIQLSHDNVTYIPFSEITYPTHFDFMFQDGTFRLGIRRTDTIVEDSTYEYIKVLQGCEFPSYNYCVNGGTKTKYVQQETLIAKRTSIVDVSDNIGMANYDKFTPKTSLPFTGIAAGWNNMIPESDPTYRCLILSFGTFGVDYLAKSKTADATNRATEAFDVGKKLTINGLPIYKIANKANKTAVSYAHGNNFFFICYPQEILQLTQKYMVPTLHIEEGTEFMDTLLPELTLKFVGGGWMQTDNGAFKLDNPVDIKDYALVDIPHAMTAGKPEAVFNGLDIEGCEFAFNIHVGDISDDSAINLVLYGSTVALYPGNGQIHLVGNGDTAEVFYGYVFAPNTDYTIEFGVTCGATSTFKFAINHLLVFNHTYNKDISNGEVSSFWCVDAKGKLTIDFYKELPTYLPTLNYGGSTTYDFVEGDPVYNFKGVVNPYSLYDDSISETSVIYDYEEGAVTDGRYNAGIWLLTIKLELEGYDTATKEVVINVHGKTSIAMISYDDGEAFAVPVGSKLVPPSNPETYRDENYDYVFDGWYFNGAKWDFENDVVQGDMHLVSKFKATARHFVVTVNFEGIENRIPEKYSLTKGSNLNFAVFELEGASYKVYLNETEITSLVVNNDVTIVVKYKVVFTYVEAKEATCLEDGNLAYWYSPIYANYYFADSEGREQISNPILPKLGHSIVHLDYKDSSCHEVGNVDCYYCKNCHTHYSDEKGENELINWSIAKKPHELTHHEAHDASCTNDGNIEHWTCANEPGVYYGDEACSFTLDDVIIRAYGHDYRAPTYEWIKEADGYKCVAKIICTHCHDEISETKAATKIVVREATCTKEGQIAYSVRFDDARFNAQNKLISVAKTDHKYVFVEGIEATKESNGVKEHYECSECHKYFVKSGDTYKEVNYTDLIYSYQTKGCGGEISTTSGILFLTAGALALLMILRRKVVR